MNYKNAVVISEAFMNLPEVKFAKMKYGARAMGIILETLRQLNKCKNSLGTYIDIDIISTETHMNISKLIEWYNDTKIFTVKILEDENISEKEYRKKCRERTLRAIIYCGRTRMCFKNVPRDPTQEEIDDVLTNGSIYIGDNRKKLGKKAAGSSEKEEKQTKTKHVTDKNSAKVELLNTQSSDTKKDAPSLIHITSSISSSSDIIRQDNNISNVPLTPKESFMPEENKEKEEGVSEDNFKNFREKVYATDKEWRNSIKSIRNVDLVSDKMLGIFAKWMYNYCVCSGKIPETTADIQHYAFWLLDKRHATRKSFDEFLEAEIQAIQERECQENMERQRKYFEELKRQSLIKEQELAEERERQERIRLAHQE